MASRALKKMRVNCWASPRSGSTSVMYSFAQRPDTKVLDEPLYAHYVSNINPTCERPYKDLLLASQENDGNKLVDKFIADEFLEGKRVLFNKHMSKHFAGFTDAAKNAILDMTNIILIRDPREVFQSFDHSPGIGESNATLYDTGIYNQLAIINELVEQKKPVFVVDYNDVVTQPEGTIRSLCEVLGLPFTESMLKWSEGGRPEDGVWAPWWYSNTHKSSGFRVGIGRSAKDIGDPEGFAPVKDEAMGMFHEILKHKVEPQ